MEVDSGRTRAVTLKTELRSASSTTLPSAPVAPAMATFFRLVDMVDLVGLRVGVVSGRGNMRIDVQITVIVGC